MRSFWLLATSFSRLFFFLVFSGLDVFCYSAMMLFVDTHATYTLSDDTVHAHPSRLSCPIVSESNRLADRSDTSGFGHPLCGVCSFVLRIMRLAYQLATRSTAGEWCNTHTIATQGSPPPTLKLCASWVILVLATINGTTHTNVKYNLVSCKRNL